MVCLDASEFDACLFNEQTFRHVTDCLLLQEQHVSLEEIFILNNLLFYSISLLSYLKMWDQVEQTFSVLKQIMAKTQDYHKKPILSMMEWKYELMRYRDFDKAEKLYEEALLFAKLLGDDYLANKLAEEWENDKT